jgi:hypothetical protein
LTISDDGNVEETHDSLGWGKRDASQWLMGMTFAIDSDDLCGGTISAWLYLEK